ncbi:hypothetical protein AAC387_Pa11g1732 [Persea americana]
MADGGKARMREGRGQGRKSDRGLGQERKSVREGDWARRGRDGQRAREKREKGSVTVLRACLGVMVQEHRELSVREMIQMKSRELSRAENRAES